MSKREIQQTLQALVAFVDPCGTETGILLENDANSMLADAPAPCVANSSANTGYCLYTTKDTNCLHYIIVEEW